MNVLKWEKARRGPDELYRLNKAHIPFRRPFPYHGHDFGEFFWTLQGNGMHDLNGQAIPIHPGDAAFIRAQDCHGFRPSTGSTMVQYNLVVPQEKLDELQARYFQNRSVFFWRKGDTPHTFTLTHAQLRRLEKAGDDLIRKPSHAFNLDHFLLNLFGELFDEPAAPVDPSVPDWLANACRQANRPEVLSRGCDGFVEVAGRSPEHVSRVFHQTMGQTLNQYLTTLRLQYAERELVSSDTPVIDIAQDCGYTSLSHFYKLFSERYGLPPRRYRMERWLYRTAQHKTG